MERRTWERKQIAIEMFRFFDDLDPAVRAAIREANYEWKVHEAMSEQHACFQTGRPIEELAARYRAQDKARFDQLMRLPPNARYSRKDVF